MHFRRLELFGFKSFGERTRLEFEPGVTAIVGPNGCGKSNIADSVKWALGEQSVKALRGLRMEDVIFNGTDAKEPVNFAEVSLTLSNESKFLPIEYDEVTITRRLYRSGESEYLLNKTPVRLKDISELIMGTGIGQSAYSLIEQGKIDRILSSKPEERREVFEEASGITKYKTKKKEALRRLQDTENNLLRVNDIISEVNRQINSIERQANKAKRYKEQYEALKDLEINLGHIEFNELNSELKNLECEINALKSRQHAHTLEIGDLKRDLENLKGSYNELDSKRLDLREGLAQFESNIFKAHSLLTLNKERLEELAKRKEALVLELNQIKDRVVPQELQLRLAKEDLKAIEEEKLSSSSLIKEKESSLSEITKTIKENEENISKNKLLLIDIASIQAKLKTQSAKVSTLLATAKARQERLTIEKERVLKEKSETGFKLSESEKNMQDTELQLKATRQQYERVLKQNNDLKAGLEDLNKNLQGLQAQEMQIHSKLGLLKEAKLRYEGFSTGVRALLTSPEVDRKSYGIHDVLANLIVVDSGYEECIEAVLGDLVESIVVDSLDSACFAIEFLKKSDVGKAQFIDLSRFKDFTNEEGLSSEDGNLIGRAIDFVQTDPRYQGILKSLLKEIYIIKDIETLRPLIEMDSINLNKTFVTLSGELIKGGIIKGGGISKKQWEILNRDIKIKELTSELEGINLKAQELKGSRLQIEERLSLLIKDTELLSASLNEKENLFTNQKAEDLKLKELFNSIRDEESLIESELEDINSEIESSENEEDSLLERIDKSTRENSLAEGSIKNSEKIISEEAKKKEQLLIEIAELKTRQSAISEKNLALLRTIQILEGTYNDSLNLFKSRGLEIESIESKTEQLKEENQGHEAHLSGLAEEKEGLLLGLSKLEEQLLESSKDISLKNKALLEYENEQNMIMESFHAKELKKGEVTFNIESLFQRMRDIYKIELLQIQIQPEVLNLDRNNLKEEINNLKSKLDSMGAVNLVAIEEQKELEERFNFLTHQRDDLLKAKDSLLKAISKINKTTRRLFIETFEKIRTEFKNYFRLLFGGGDGDLLLMDDSDVLECGIEIVARPPGKRLQNISLLSGGEKSLTAIALLFAIFKARPSPFCVLDEIDAALDEANIDRFTRVLEDFVKFSQFIIITHNKRTINMADVMYGITMEDSGISKVVSVRFAEKTEEVQAPNIEP